MIAIVLHRGRRFLTRLAGFGHPPRDRIGFAGTLPETRRTWDTEVVVP
ncbi:hypothetical protein ACUNV4_05170 [Granulosicoccus sp. 3-233]